MFNTFAKKFSNNIVNITKVKINEITKNYLNNTIKKYLNTNVNDYIKLNIVNNNIVSVDIDSNKTNVLLKNIISDLEENSEKITSGEINKYYNLEILKGKNGIFLLIPIGVAYNNALLSNLGPKIPIKASFLENSDAYVDVKVEEYGINNALIKLYIVIDINEIIEMPIQSESSNISYRFLIASKLVNGKVPNYLGAGLYDSSNIVNNNVN